MSFNTFEFNVGLNYAEQTFSNIPENCQLQQGVDPMRIRYFVNGPEEIRKQIASMSLEDCDVDGKEEASVSAQEKPKSLSEPAITSIQSDINAIKECFVLVVPLTEQEIEQFVRKPHTSIACSNPVAEIADMKISDRRSKKKKSTSRSKKSSHKKHKKRKQHRKEREMTESSVQNQVAKSHRRRRKRSSSSDSLFEKVFSVPTKKRRSSGINEPKTTSAESLEAPPQLPVVEDPTPECFLDGIYTSSMMNEDSTPDVSLLESLLFQPSSGEEPRFPLDDEMEQGSTHLGLGETQDAQQDNQTLNLSTLKTEEEDGYPRDAQQDDQTLNLSMSMLKTEEENGYPHDAQQDSPNDPHQDYPRDAHQDNQTQNLSMLKTEEEDGLPSPDSEFDHFYSYCQEDVLIISIDDEEFLPMPPPYTIK